MSSPALRAVGRTLAEFKDAKGKLAPAEQKFLEACRAGAIATIADTRPTEATADNTVRASFLRFLILGGDDEAPVHEHGVRLSGAWIDAALDLDEARVPHFVGCLDCKIDGSVILSDARLESGIAFSGSAVAGIQGERVIVGGSVYLRDGFESSGTIRLGGATIGGSLVVLSAKLQVNKDDALVLDNADITDDVILNKGLEATGAILLSSARIGGSLDCAEAKLSVNRGVAVSFDNADITGNVFLNKGFETLGEIRLLGTRIGGGLICDGAKLLVKGGDALSLDNAKIGGGVFLNGGFEATGKIRMLGARISGSLVCEGARLRVENGDALSIDSADIFGDVFVRAGFEATGRIRIHGARINRSLDFGGAKLLVKDGDALSSDRAEIGGGVFMNEGFEATGKIRLNGAKVTGSLVCDGAKLRVARGDALSLDNADISGSVFLRTGFEATGTIGLPGARIRGNLECVDAKLQPEHGDGLFAQLMRVEGAFLFREMRQPVKGVDLSAATVGQLADDQLAWGEGLVLDGFQYGSFAGTQPLGASPRLAWLDKQRPALRGRRGDGDGRDFRPQPWQQLQKVLREMGHLEAAREVAIAFERRLREADRIGQSAPGSPVLLSKLNRLCTRALHGTFGLLTGYGHRPMRLMAALVLVWLGCAAFYGWAAARQAVFAPSDVGVAENPKCAVAVPGSAAAKAELAKPRPMRGAGNWYFYEGLPDGYTGFSPLGYSLDVILPVVDLQQEGNWSPRIPVPDEDWRRELLHWNWGHVARLVIWFEMLFGWVATLLLAAIVSGLAKRQEE